MKNTLSLNVYLADFEQDEYIEKIENFCLSCGIDDAIKRNIELAFEELVKNNIVMFIEHNDDRGLPVNITVEHDPDTNEAIMTISYTGERFDPIYDGDELSSLVVRKLVSSVKHDYDDMNTITIKLG